MTANGDDLPKPNHVVRYVPYGRMRKDPDTDAPLGPEPTAFAVRDTETYLSTTWCEYFAGTSPQQLRCAVEAIRNSRLSVAPKACFCVAETSALLEGMAKMGRIGRILYHPEDDNPAHAGVYGIRADDLRLLSFLADEIWNAFLTREAANALPNEGCNKSLDIT